MPKPSALDAALTHEAPFSKRVSIVPPLKVVKYVLAGQCLENRPRVWYTPPHLTPIATQRHIVCCEYPFTYSL